MLSLGSNSGNLVKYIMVNIFGVLFFFFFTPAVESLPTIFLIVLNIDMTLLKHVD